MPNGQYITRQYTGIQQVSSGGGGGAGSPVIIGQTLGALRSNFTGIPGFQFTVGAAPITVTDLGLWMVALNSQAHTIYLTDSLGNVLGSVLLNASGQTPATYFYGSITPTLLSASTTYCVIGQQTSSGDQFYDDDTTVTSTSDITVTTSCYAITPGGVITTSIGGLHAYGPTNFKYHL